MGSSEGEMIWDDGPTVVVAGLDEGAFFADRYKIGAPLGAGAMGRVYRAVDLREERPVALKVLRPDKAAKSSILERFRREATILRTVGHPGIVQVFDAGRASDGTDYIAMELLEGQTLKQRLREKGPFSPEGLLPILGAVCDAMAVAHEREVVHRDLKPDNVFLLAGSDPPAVKVLDFGLGRLATAPRTTQTGVAIGTPRYMAPEQIRSARHADARTDVYACGVLAHELLTGRSPFPAEDAGQLLGCILSGRILRLEDERPELPPGLGEVIRKAMAVDPNDRYAAIWSFAEAYAHAIGRPVPPRQATGVVAPISSGSEGRDAPAYERPRFTRPGFRRRRSAGRRSRPRRITWIAFGALLLLVALVAAGLALVLRGLLS